MCVCVCSINFVKWNNGCYEDDCKESLKGKTKMKYEDAILCVDVSHLGTWGWEGRAEMVDSGRL